jgi:hypothetical protein
MDQTTVLEAAAEAGDNNAYYTKPYLSFVLWGRRLAYMSRYRYDCLPGILRSAADDCLILDKKD